MRLNLFGPMIVVVGTLLTTGCVGVAVKTGDAIFQRFEFGNDGQGEVHSVKVQYGNFMIPTGTAHKDYGPSHLIVFSESMVIPVPETATVNWISADGKQHSITAPVRSYVDNPSCFHGFRFFFVDDHVDIYELNRRGDCTRLQGIERTKVFPPRSGN